MEFSQYKRGVIIAAIMLATMLLLYFVSHSEQIEPNKPFNTFPMRIGDWKGIPEKFDPAVYDVLGVDDSVLANYSSNKRGSVNLYIGFYQSQKEGDLIHSPKNCLPGAGWNITKTAIETIDVSNEKAKRQINVIRLILEKDSQKQVVLYWFHARGKILSSEYMQKIWLVIDSITKNRTDEAFVRLISPVVNDETETIDLMKEFTKEIFPYLTEYIPS